jgi:hypothetical protein
LIVPSEANELYSAPKSGDGNTFNVSSGTSVRLATSVLADLPMDADHPATLVAQLSTPMTTELVSEYTRHVPTIGHVGRDGRRIKSGPQILRTSADYSPEVPS